MVGSKGYCYREITVGLREIAENDLQVTLEDSQCGFGYPIQLINPAGVSANFIGYSNDIAQLIDPDTGVSVSGRRASIALRISSLTAAGFDLPYGISDSSLKPWIAIFTDINGASFTFKIVNSDPDRALGLVICLLESYTA